MIPLLLAARGLGRALAAVWRDPETRALPVVAGVLVLTGTLFYWRFEDWTVVEALYFCVVTLTTVGYGDLSPTTAGTQIFTIIYILTGLGVLVALLASVAQQYLRQKSEGGRARPRLRARRRRDEPTEEDPTESAGAAHASRGRHCLGVALRAALPVTDPLAVRPARAIEVDRAAPHFGDGGIETAELFFDAPLGARAVPSREAPRAVLGAVARSAPMSRRTRGSRSARAS